MAQLDAYDQRPASPILCDASEWSEEFFTTRLDALKAEGRSRVFAELERRVGEFPRALEHGNLRAVFLTAGILLSLPFTVDAQAQPSAHNGSCRSAYLNGQRVQPAVECHLPPPLAQNPTSVQNTTLASRQVIDRLANDLLRQSAASAEPRLDGSSTTRPLPRPQIEEE